MPALVHQAAMRAFVRGFGVETAEAELGVSEYATFQEFFTRRLKAGARPLEGDESTVASPVDARVAALGIAEEGKLVQAKGSEYSLATLLNDPLDGRTFEGGAYLTLYLSPRDYHRIHAPLSGEIEGYSYIPGELYPVNALGVRWVPELFCSNERLVTFLGRGPAGKVAVVKVGAMCVGRIRASYDDVVTHAGRGVSRRRYERTVPIKRGEELGVFELGSTVILLFERGRVVLEPSLAEGSRVRVGQAIARVAGETG
ncbi:MAG: phosphatidylserine decarboxylase [Deltaproteobacteria bacterium]|nr:phosphatidylserine decarboxylase [Deltaproteobacteria bacterium]